MIVPAHRRYMTPADAFTEKPYELPGGEMQYVHCPPGVGWRLHWFIFCRVDEVGESG